MFVATTAVDMLLLVTKAQTTDIETVARQFQTPHTPAQERLSNARLNKWVVL